MNNVIFKNKNIYWHISAEGDVESVKESLVSYQDWRDMSLVDAKAYAIDECLKHGCTNINIKITK